MKFVRILSLSLACLVAPFMVASAPADSDQAYKTEKAKVDKVAKEKKVRVKKGVAAAKAKTAKIEKKAKTEKSAKVAKTPKTIETPKATKPAKHTHVKKHAESSVADKTTHADKGTTAPTHRIGNVRTLEPITVVVGEEFMVKRPASPNFGRTWKLHQPVPLQLEMIGEAKFVPAEHPGRNEGTMIFTFKGTRPGNVKIEFEKIYPPELRDKKPLKVRVVPVTIKAADSK